MTAYIKSLRGGEDVIFRGAPVVLFFHVPRKNNTGYTDGVNVTRRAGGRRLLYGFDELLRTQTATSCYW